MLFPLHQVLICKTVVLLQLRRFWDTFQSKLADKSPYTASIEGMRIRFLGLQDDDKKAKKLRSEQVLSEGWEDIEQMLYYQGFLYVPKVIRLELINKHYNNLLVSHFSIEKTWELIARKYYWPILQQDIEAYIKGCNICLALKAVCQKLYGNL